MAFPVVHLFIAYRIYKYLNIESTQDYYLGAISPDAIGVRDKWTRDEKRILHLAKKEDTLYDRLKRVERFLAAHSGSTRDFSIGYAVHIHSDNLWSHLIGRYYRRKISPHVKHVDPVMTYYRDLAIIDSFLAKKTDDMHDIAAILTAATRKDGFMLLNADDIVRWKEKVVLDINNEEMNQATPTLFETHMVEDYIEACDGILRRVFTEKNIELLSHADQEYKEHSIGEKYFTNIVSAV